jgi:hypothetical protein
MAIFGKPVSTITASDLQELLEEFARDFLPERLLRINSTDM